MTNEGLNDTEPVSGATNESDAPQTTPHAGSLTTRIESLNSIFMPGLDIRLQLWLYSVVGIPFLILVIVGGWGNEFRSGDASAFMCGAIIAAFAENILEQIDQRIMHRKENGGNVYKRKERQLQIFGVSIVAIYLVGSLIWNGYFAVADKAIVHPSVDKVQIVVFFATFALLPLFRGVALATRSNACPQAGSLDH
jgi:hypothetical protein